MWLKGSPWQEGHCTVWGGTMTVLTVFRSVSLLHKPEQGTAAEGGRCRSHSTLDKYNNKQGTKERMKGAVLNDNGLRRPGAARESCGLAFVCSALPPMWGGKHGRLRIDVVPKLF